MKYPEQKLNPQWVHSTITDEVVEWTKSFAEFLTKKEYRKGALSTTQLRRFFGEIKRISADFESNKKDLPMLKPLLAYAVGRDKDDKGNNKTKIKEFEEEITKALNAIRSEDNKVKDFKNFVKIFESIVAYHKFYGGKQK